MKSTDRMLVGIVIGAVLLVAAALAVTFLRPKPAYQSEDSPEGVVHNYLLALRQEDYQRAHGYLAPSLAGYPPLPQVFERNVRENSWQFGLGDTTTALQILSATVNAGVATVIVEETSFYQGGLFGSSQSTRTFEVRLRPDPSGKTWMIVDADRYWAPCWSWDNGCR